MNEPLTTANLSIITQEVTSAIHVLCLVSSAVDPSLLSFDEDDLSLPAKMSSMDLHQAQQV